MSTTTMGYLFQLGWEAFFVAAGIHYHKAVPIVVAALMFICTAALWIGQYLKDHVVSGPCGMYLSKRNQNR